MTDRDKIIAWCERSIKKIREASDGYIRELYRAESTRADTELKVIDGAMREIYSNVEPSSLSYKIGFDISRSIKKRACIEGAHAKHSEHHVNYDNPYYSDFCPETYPQLKGENKKKLIKCLELLREDSIKEGNVVSILYKYSENHVCLVITWPSKLRWMIAKKEAESENLSSNR